MKQNFVTRDSSGNVNINFKKGCALIIFLSFLFGVGISLGDLVVINGIQVLKAVGKAAIEEPLIIKDKRADKKLF